MIYALYYKNRLQYKRACKDLITFKNCAYKQRQRLFKAVGYSDIANNFNKLFNRRFKHIVDGWELREYRNYKLVPELISKSNVRAKRDRREVLNYFYVMDIESTNVNNQYSLCYLYGIRKYNYSPDFNDDNINQYAEEYRAFYGKTAIKEFFNYLNEINQTAKKACKMAVIYAHNLNFDLFELIQNIFPLFDLKDSEIEDCINGSIYRGSAVKVLKFQFKNLIFIDSLALINKSLKKVSESHKVKKLVELKTYKEQYFFGSELPPEELEYNAHDLDVTALGIYDSIRSLKTEFKTFNDFYNSNVLTITSVSKYLNKHIYSDKNENSKIINEHIFQASRNLPKLEENNTKIIDKKRLLFYQEVFQGGFTHANPFIAYNTNIFLEGDKK